MRHRLSMYPTLLSMYPTLALGCHIGVQHSDADVRRAGHEVPPVDTDARKELRQVAQCCHLRELRLRTAHPHPIVRLLRLYGAGVRVLSDRDLGATATSARPRPRRDRDLGEEYSRRHGRLASPTALAPM